MTLVVGHCRFPVWPVDRWRMVSNHTKPVEKPVPNSSATFHRHMMSEHLADNRNIRTTVADSPMVVGMVCCIPDCMQATISLDTVPAFRIHRCLRSNDSFRLHCRTRHRTRHVSCISWLRFLRSSR